MTTNPSANYFSSVADQWDALRSGYFSEAVRQAAFARAYLHPSMIAADVGAGTGFIASGLAPLVSQVHVLDGSPEMLGVARKNLAGFNNVQYHLADGLSLPLPDESLDVSFANMYLHHFTDPLAAIREIVRMLRPGGRLVITDLDVHDQAWIKTEMADVWLGFEHDQIRSWFEQAGLVNVLVDSTGQMCTPKSQSTSSEQVEIGIFVATGTRRMSVHESVQANYAAHALGGGCGCGEPASDLISLESVDTAPQSQAAGCGCGDSSCCAPDMVSLDNVSVAGNFDTVEWKTGYSTAEKADVPAEAAEISLGCGNPLAMARLRPGESVLDIGSGGGIDVFLAAKRVGPEGRVIGVDMTPAMLQRARRTAKKNGYTNVTFRHGYAEKLPLKAAEVDVVISNCVINLTEDKGKVFREAYRVLKAGGRLEVNDVVFGGAVPPAERYSLASWAECVSGALPEPEYVDLVKQAGFKHVSVQRSTSAGTSSGVAVYSVQVSAIK